MEKMREWRGQPDKHQQHHPDSQHCRGHRVNKENGQPMDATQNDEARDLAITKSDKAGLDDQVERIQQTDPIQREDPAHQHDDPRHGEDPALAKDPDQRNNPAISDSKHQEDLVHEQDPMDLGHNVDPKHPEDSDPHVDSNRKGRGQAEARNKRKKAKNKRNKAIDTRIKRQLTEIDLAKTNKRLSIELPRCNWLEHKIKMMKGERSSIGSSDPDPTNRRLSNSLSSEATELADGTIAADLKRCESSPTEEAIIIHNLADSEDRASEENQAKKSHTEDTRRSADNRPPGRLADAGKEKIPHETNSCKMPPASWAETEVACDNPSIDKKGDLNLKDRDVGEKRPLIGRTKVTESLKNELSPDDDVIRAAARDCRIAEVECNDDSRPKRARKETDTGDVTSSTQDSDDSDEHDKRKTVTDVNSRRKSQEPCGNDAEEMILLAKKIQLTQDIQEITAKKYKELRHLATIQQARENILKELDLCRKELQKAHTPAPEVVKSVFHRQTLPASTPEPKARVSSSGTRWEAKEGAIQEEDKIDTVCRELRPNSDNNRADGKTTTPPASGFQPYVRPGAKSVKIEPSGASRAFLQPNLMSLPPSVGSQKLHAHSSSVTPSLRATAVGEPQLFAVPASAKQARSEKQGPGSVPTPGMQGPGSVPTPGLLPRYEEQGPGSVPATAKNAPFGELGVGVTASDEPNRREPQSAAIVKGPNSRLLADCRFGSPDTWQQTLDQGLRVWNMINREASVWFDGGDHVAGVRQAEEQKRAASQQPPESSQGREIPCKQPLFPSLSSSRDPAPGRSEMAESSYTFNLPGQQNRWPHWSLAQQQQLIHQQHKQLRLQQQQHLLHQQLQRQHQRLLLQHQQQRKQQQQQQKQQQQQQQHDQRKQQQQLERPQRQDGSQMPSSQRSSSQKVGGKCEHCGMEAQFMCSACQLSHYCSSHCQTQNWLWHSPHCRMNV